MADKMTLSEEDFENSSEGLDLSELFDAAGQNEGNVINDVNIKNINNIIAALKDEKFQQDYPFATKAANELINGLEEVLASQELENLPDLKKVFGDYQKNIEWKVRACLAHYLRETGKCYVPVVKKVETLSDIIKYRVRSDDNFDNDSQMRKIELDVLHGGLFKGREVISDDDYNKAKDILDRMLQVRDVAGIGDGGVVADIVSPEEVAEAYEIVNKGVDNIPQKDEDKFKELLADKVIETISQNYENELAQQLATPEVLALAIEGYDRQLKEDKFKDDQEKQDVERKRKVALEVANMRVREMAEGRGYFFADITNAADLYDGYNRVIAICREDDKANNNGSNASLYGKAQQNIDDYVAVYDQYYNIPKKVDSAVVAKGYVPHINDNVTYYGKIIDEMEFTEANLGQDGREFLETLRNYRFISEYQGDTPVYEECVKEDNNGQLYVVPGSSLEAVLRSSALDESLRVLDARPKDRLSKEELLDRAKGNAFSTLMAFDNAEKTIKLGLKEEFDKFTDPKHVAEFRQALESGQTMEMSPLGMDLALKRNASKVETYGNRLRNRLDHDSTEYVRSALHDQIVKLDNRLSDDNKKKYGQTAKAVKRAGIRRAWIGGVFSAVIAGATSYGITKASLSVPFLAKGTNTALVTQVSSGGVALGFGQELIRGGGKALVGAVAGAAVSTLAYVGVKKITAIVKKQKYTWQDVKNDLRDPRTIGVIAAGALSGASLGFAMSGCPKCAVACGVGAFAAGGFAKYIGPYRDLRAKGVKRLSAVLQAVGISAMTIGAGLAGHKLAMQGATEQTQEVVVKDKKRAEDLLKKSEKDLKAAGIRREDTQLPDGQAPKGDGWIQTGTHREEHWGADLAANCQNRLYRNYDKEWVDRMIDNAVKNGATREDALVQMNHQLVYQQHNGIDKANIIPQLKIGQHAGANDFVSTSGGYLKQWDGNMCLSPKLGQNDGPFDFVNGTYDISKVANLDKLPFDPRYGSISYYAGAPKVNLGAEAVTASGTVKSGWSIFTGKNSAGENIPLADAGAKSPSFSSSYMNSSSSKDVTITNFFGRVFETLKQSPVAAMGMLIVEPFHRLKRAIRPGAKADKVLPLQEKKVVETKKVYAPTFIPKPKPKPKPKPEPTPVYDPQLLLDEYKIVYGGTLCKEDRTGKIELDANGEPQFINKDCKDRFDKYYDMVEEERQAEEFQGDMNEYLRTRMQRLDEMVERKCGETNTTPVAKLYQEMDKDHVREGTEADKLDDNGNRTVRIKADYKAHADEGSRASAAVVANTRTAWMESNLSKEYRTKLTLTHFMGYMEHVIVKDDLVADGSRNPDLNIMFKNNPKSIKVVDTDTVIFGKEVTGRDVVIKNVEINSGDNVLKKELAVRQALDELHGVDSNPKTNELKARIDRIAKHKEEEKAKKGNIGKGNNGKGKDGIVRTGGNSGPLR